MQNEDLVFIKEQLLLQCAQFVESRIETSQKAIKSAQESANSDSKSSMGDKYETGRAMAQLEIEKNTMQLAEAHKLKIQLEAVPRHGFDKKIRNGSLVSTNEGNYFLAISAGKIQIESKPFFVISSSSPLGSILLNRAEGDELEFQGRKIHIERVA